MAIKVGDRLPNGTLNEFIEVEKEGCTIGPNTFKVEDMVKGKKIAIFGLPGLSRQPARPNMCRVMSAISTRSRPRAWMKSGASRSIDAFVMWSLGKGSKGRRQGTR